MKQKKKGFFLFFVEIYLLFYMEALKYLLKEIDEKNERDFILIILAYSLFVLVYFLNFKVT